MASLRSLKSSIFEREEKKQQYQSHIRGLNAYDRHKKFMKDYAQFYGREGNMNDALPVRTDQDALREGYRFILSEEDDMDSTWEKRLVKRYYDKLFKEYCIADMSQYRKGKIGLRWRTEKEVISGKGQFVCGNKKCDEKDGLGSYEVNFSYVEAGEHKQALVKLVACKSKTEIPLKLSIQDKRKVIAEEQNICAEKLVYRREKEKEQSTVKEKNRDKRKRDIEGSHDSTDDERSKSTDRRKKGRKSTSSGDNNVENENFDEFLEGMFP